MTTSLTLNTHMITIDKLKSLANKDPYYHGIGCIRVRVETGELYSFYSKEHTAPISNYIHTHQRDLYCESLYGSYKNTTYDYTITNEYTNYCMEKIACKTGTKPELMFPNILITEKCVSILEKDMSHSHSGFHRVDLIDDIVITKVTMGGIRLPTAKIIRNKNIPYVCGLSSRGTPENNWGIIEDILNEAR